MRRSLEQKPDKKGIRHIRAAIIRNTYRELEDTTLQTWLKAYPEEEFGPFKYHGMIHHIETGNLNADFIFRSLDRPADIKKLLSMELTFAWVNEAREIYSKNLILGLLDAIGRYPAVEDGGPTWWGIFMDTNAPDTDHWWYKISEEDRPKGWEFWKQPGALLEEKGQYVPNPKAENINNIVGGFDWYLSRAAAASKDHVNVYYCNKYGFVADGRPIYPEYHDGIHCPGELFRPVPDLPIYIGLDFGLTPAALFAQKLINGRWIWFDELVTQEMGIQRFSELLTPKLNEYSTWKEIKIFGDPAGKTRAQTDEKTCYEILEAAKIKAEPACINNNFTLRREAVAASLRRLIDGKPGLMLSPACKVTRKGMQGGYYFKRIQVLNEERYQDEPYKNQYSHVCEAGQYAMLGAGEGEVLTNSVNPPLKLSVNESRINASFGWMR
jgi:hypothetical protein